jgi:GNAT superfamily N-acetyltransferase
MSPNVRTATVDDREGVITTVVAAFRADPAFRFFFPNDDDYDRQAGLFAGYLFDKRVRHDSVWVTDHLEAASLWSPPAHLAEDPSGRLATEEARLRQIMLEAIGEASASRLAAYDGAVDSVLPDGSPYWYLGVLALHPEHTGTGLGRAVMQAGVDHARSSNGTAFLETSNPQNVGYYERFGWTVFAQVDTDVPLEIWLLTQS